jgi:hypothetical protein
MSLTNSRGVRFDRADPQTHADSCPADLRLPEAAPFQHDERDCFVMSRIEDAHRRLGDRSTSSPTKGGRDGRGARSVEQGASDD